MQEEVDRIVRLLNMGLGVTDAQQWLLRNGFPYLEKEDRANVLRWNVLAVHAAKEHLMGIMSPWHRGITGWRRTGISIDYTDAIKVAGVKVNEYGNIEYEVREYSDGCNLIQFDGVINVSDPLCTDEEAQSRCDQELLRRRWAITDHDGSTEFPELPKKVS